MLFRDLKQNYPVYILNKQELSLQQGKAVSISFPRLDLNPKSGKSEMVVDVCIELNGKTGTYTIPEGLSITYAGDLVISTDRNGLLNEIEAMRSISNQVLSSIEQHKKILSKTSELLEELNPEYKEKQETEKRFNTIEQSVNELKDMMSNFIKEFKS